MVSLEFKQIYSFISDYIIFINRLKCMLFINYYFKRVLNDYFIIFYLKYIYLHNRG